MKTAHNSTAMFTAAIALNELAAVAECCAALEAAELAGDLTADAQFEVQYERRHALNVLPATTKPASMADAAGMVAVAEAIGDYLINHTQVEDANSALRRQCDLLAAVSVFLAASAPDDKPTEVAQLRAA